MAAPPKSDLPGVPRWIAVLAGRDPTAAVALKLAFIRVLIVVNLCLLTYYLTWRGLYTLSWTAWPLSLALFAAEVYSFVDTSLFCLGVWRIRTRGEPPPAPAAATVDVFITCYNEPVELVRATARAARNIRHPHDTWVLDDGNSAAMRTMAGEEGVGYLTRAPMWSGKERHAKAGNLINGLYHTTGQFILVLDADQVPACEILDRTLGYFDDPRVAFVQTPQWFSNVPEGDPFGTAAPLFYGPIQQGKDGWNAAFFCGSNAVLRREALMHAGIVTYVREIDAGIRRAIDGSDGGLRSAAGTLDPLHASAWAALRAAGGGVREAQAGLAAGVQLQDVTWKFQRRLREASVAVVAQDCESIDATLSQTPGVAPEMRTNAAAWPFLSTKANSPLAAIAHIRELMSDLDLDRSHEAEPVHPLATISITEDMATAMRLHALGYHSVYHDEVLAVGLAPDELRSVLQQRLRWAQGTMQVLLRENPLTQRGLSWPQRLLYFSTMWSYLSGFASIVYLLAPALYLLFGWLPVRTLDTSILVLLVPCLVVNQLLFALVGHGISTWRGQQYSLALFPLWITAVVNAVGNVYFGKRLAFVVTPKTRQGGAQFSLVRPQILLILLLLGAVLVGMADLALSPFTDTFPIVINLAWAAYSVAMLGVIVRAAYWQPTLTKSAT